ncbi:MAG: hypothetical protein N2322_01615 [Terrimicrobiaceae bacterium]|nr:hypothetical protein [Terrimicrobiaceae bacterium]
MGLLDTTESVWVRLDASKEIAAASDVVFREENQEEARTLIYEGHFFLDYLEEFSKALGLGEPQFAVVTERERQTSFRYGREGAEAVLLTRAHQNAADIQRALEAAGR